MLLLCYAPPGHYFDPLSQFFLDNRIVELVDGGDVLEEGLVAVAPQQRRHVVVLSVVEAQGPVMQYLSQFLSFLTAMQYTFKRKLLNYHSIETFYFEVFYNSYSRFESSVGIIPVIGNTSNDLGCPSSLELYEKLFF